MIVIVSPSVSASSIACVVSTTTRSRFDFSMTSHTPRRFTGSIPVVGSSRYTTFGSAISEHATERRRFIPPEYARDGRSAVRGSSSSTAPSKPRVLGVRPTAARYASHLERESARERERERERETKWTHAPQLHPRPRREARARRT